MERERVLQGRRVPETQGRALPCPLNCNFESFRNVLSLTLAFFFSELRHTFWLRNEEVAEKSY